MDKHFLQLVGTAAGTKAAPPYANLFMGLMEETICEASIWAILFRKRFLDDIFLIFLGNTNQPQSLQDFMNHLHAAIKFTFQHSTKQISLFTFQHSAQKMSFLDTTIQIRANWKIFITLSRRPTDCAALLHFHSNHSLKFKESLVFSQAPRCNLLIVDDHLLQKELDCLVISLLTRKYPSYIITSSISKALIHPWRPPPQTQKDIRSRNSYRNHYPIFSRAMTDQRPMTYHWKWLPN